ncbi:MAG: HEAT repeat domain-containing protein [bacterium]
MSEPHRHRPVDDKLYGEMMDFVHKTVSLRRAFILYGRHNAMCVENLEQWHEAVSPLFKERDSIEITTAGNKLFFGDSLLSAESPFVRELTENLRRLIIRRLTLQDGIEEREIFLLMEMLSSESRALLLKGGPVSFVKEAGVEHVSVIENVYLKRVGQAGEISLDQIELSDEDLHFIQRQLESMIDLRREGFELRREERGLLSEVAQHPTFMGELIKEMAGSEAGAPAEDAVAQAEEMSEILEILAAEMRKGERSSQASLSDSFSNVLLTFDETTRLEILHAQYKTAGQLPPLLNDSVFACLPERVGDFILDICRRDEKAPQKVGPLIKRLIPNEEALQKVIPSLNAAGVTKDAVQQLLKEITDLYKPPPAPLHKEAPQTGIQEMVRGIEKKSPPPLEFADSLAGVDDRREEAPVLSELLMGGAASLKLVCAAAARVRSLVKSGSTDGACMLFSALLAASSVDKSLGDTVRKEAKSLCEGEELRSILVAPLPLDDRGGLVAAAVRVLSPEDGARLWERLVSDSDERLHEALADAGRREAHGVAELVRRQIAEGSIGLARGLDVLAAIPTELSTPILMELCNHPQSGVRLKAVALLGRVGAKRAAPLVSMLAGDSEREVRRVAIPVLGRLGGEAAVGRLLEIVEDSGGQWDAEDKTLACRALARSGGERAVPALAKLLREIREQGDERASRLLLASVRFALESIAGPAARDALKVDADRPSSFLGRLFGRK